MLGLMTITWAWAENTLASDIQLDRVDDQAPILVVRRVGDRDRRLRGAHHLVAADQRNIEHRLRDDRGPTARAAFGIGGARSLDREQHVVGIARRDAGDLRRGGATAPIVRRARDRGVGIKRLC